MSKRTDALLEAKPGGKDWQEASPSARIVAAGFHELATSLDGLDSTAQANQALADSVSLLGRSLEEGLTALANATKENE